MQDPGRFTVAVFQDASWARRGLAALARAGFSSESLTIVAKNSVDTASLVHDTLGQACEPLDLSGIGPALARGPLVEALQGSAADFATLGLAGTMRRVGFQAHDARIYDALTARGGVLVAVRDEPRAADALAIFFSYGGANAAIGAWAGRV